MACCACLVPLGAAAAGAPIWLQVAASLVSIFLLFSLLVNLERLETSLLALIPLMIVVRIEPAPIDYFAVSCFVAMVLRGYFAPCRLPRSARIGAALLMVGSGIALPLAASKLRGVEFGATTAYMLCIGYLVFKSASRASHFVSAGYLTAALILAVVSILALLPAQLFSGLRFDQYRVQGLFKDPNVYGPFPIPAIMLLLAGRFNLRATVRFLLIGFLSLPVALSLSRGALLALGVSILVFTLVSVRQGWWLHLPLAFLLAALGLVLGFQALQQQDPTNILQQRLRGQAYDSQRFAAQTAGLQYVITSPLSLGIGPGNYESFFGIASHETYLRVLVEDGALGLIGLVCLMVTGMAALKQNSAEASAWGAALVGFAAAGVFIDALHWRHLWVVLGVTTLWAYRPNAAYVASVRSHIWLP